jgi:hypothetical protein
MVSGQAFGQYVHRSAAGLGAFGETQLEWKRNIARKLPGRDVFPVFV